MTTGIYGKVNLAAATDTVLVGNTTVDAGKTAVITVNMVNTNSTTNASIRVALSQSNAAGNLQAGDFIEYDTPLGGTGVLERTGIVLPAGWGITVRSTVANVNAIAYGIESV